MDGAIMRSGQNCQINPPCCERPSVSMSGALAPNQLWQRTACQTWIVLLSWSTARLKCGGNAVVAITDSSLAMQREGRPQDCLTGTRFEQPTIAPGCGAVTPS